MAKKLYVGGLPYSTTDEELKEYFAAAGNVVSASVIIDKMSGRSKGFGFVEMSTDEEAQDAVSRFDGKDFGGRNLIVNEAKPMTDRPAPRRSNFGSGGGGGSRGGFGGGGGGGGYNRGGGY